MGSSPSFPKKCQYQFYTHTHTLDMFVILRVVLGESMSTREKIPLRRESVENNYLEYSYETLYHLSKEAQGREVQVSTAIYD